MSPHIPTTNPPPSISNPQKRARLPDKAIITKRPLTHPPIPTPLSAAQQTIYLRTTTPFIATIKRITRLLAQISARRTQGTKPRGELTPAAVEKATAEVARRIKSGRGEGEAVCVKASGRAIERALGVAGFFLGKGDVRVRVRTGSVGVVDDVEMPEEEEEDEKMGGVEGKGVGEKIKVGEEEDEEVPEAKVRQISFVEVWISAK